MAGDNNKNTVVYIIRDGLAQGSFRGRVSSVDYRGFFEGYADNIFAQGHKAAFGFKVLPEMIEGIMAKLSDIEDISDGLYLTAGAIEEQFIGEHHISDIEEFKRQGNLWRLAIANSKLSSDEQLNITVPAVEAVLIENKRSVFIYEVLGLTCKAFEPLTTKLISVYLEYSNNIEIYVRNYNILENGGNE